MARSGTINKVKKKYYLYILFFILLLANVALYFYLSGDLQCSSCGENKIQPTPRAGTIVNSDKNNTEGDVKMGTNNSSQISLYVDSNINLSVYDSNGEKIDGLYSTENPIQAADGELSGGKLNAFEYTDAKNDTYTVKLTGSGEYQIDASVITKSGNTYSEIFIGNLNNNETDELIVNIGESNTEFNFID